MYLQLLSSGKCYQIRYVGTASQCRVYKQRLRCAGVTPYAVSFDHGTRQSSHASEIS